MKNIFRFTAFFTVVLAASAAWTAPFNTRSFSSETVTGLKITSKGKTGFSAVNTLSYINLSRIDSGQGSFASIEAQGYTQGTGAKGGPHTPVLDNLIEIPRNATVQVVINAIREENVNFETLSGGLKLVPRQPGRVKSPAAGKQPFVFDQGAYAKNAFNDNPWVTVEILGSMRGVRVGRLTVNPFRYNPKTNTLNAATRLSFSVVFKNGDMALTKKTRAKYASPAFTSAYAKIINYPVSDGSKDAVISSENRAYPLTYVVVASDAFLASSSLQEFIEWKRDQGFNVIEASTDDIFNSSKATVVSDSTKRDRLKEYLKDLYDNGTTPPSYVLLVGDTGEIPPFIINDHITDLYYFTFSGGYLPEAYYGRFPVHTLSELNAVVSKTLTYEKYTMASGSYLNQALVIAGADADYSPTYANGQVAYLLNEYLNTGNNYTDIFAFLYNVSWTWQNTTTSQTGPSLVTSSIKSRITSGVGIVNYTGHCDEDGWWNKTAFDYEFDSSDIPILANDDKFGFFVSNCCRSGALAKLNTINNSLEDYDSFGEKLVLASDKGAVAYIGASADTFWEQDFYWAVGYKKDIENMEDYEVENLSYNDTGFGNFDALWHNHGENQDAWYVTAGQMVYSGNLSVALESPTYASYYFEVYTLFGDPSIMPYLAASGSRVLADPSVSQTITPCETTQLDVTTATYAQVAILHNGEMVDSAYTGATGKASLNFAAFANNDTAQLVIIKQNYRPKYYTVTVENLSSHPPVADFMLGNDPDAASVEVTSGSPVTFTNLSSGCPDNYDWTFDGGSPGTSVDKNPTVTYNDLGTFDVRLVASNGKGDETKLKSGYITVKPGIYFSADQTRFPVGTTVVFSDNSTNNPTAWLWTFTGGTPSTSTAQNPQVTYSPNLGTAGSISYPVTLTVTIGGNPYTLTKDNYITVTVEKPVANFSSDKQVVKGGEQITFTDSSTNSPTRLNWSFTGGSPANSIAESPVVTYNTKGTYTVVLVATNDGGSDTEIKTGYITVTDNAPGTNPQGVENGNGGGCFILSTR
jgi:PKD repeat protein